MHVRDKQSWICASFFLSLLWLAVQSSHGYAAEPTHIVLMIGEDEYKTEVTLPRFVQTELEPRGLRCSLVIADTKQPHNFPGIEALTSADLLFVSVRRRAPKTEQLEAVRQFLAAGKPFVGIRTACHAFHTRGKHDEGHAEWQAFDPEVLGGHYTGHYPDGPKTAISLAPNAADHPILEGVKTDGWVGHGSLYKVSPLAKSTTPLLIGKIDNQSAEPIAWTHAYHEGRVFFTSLGHPGDFETPQFNKLLVNAVFWGLDKPVPDKSKTK
jgi:type 1 glutamine amidotransferase